MEVAGLSCASRARRLRRASGLRSQLAAGGRHASEVVLSLKKINLPHPKLKFFKDVMGWNGHFYLGV